MSWWIVCLWHCKVSFSICGRLVLDVAPQCPSINICLLAQNSSGKFTAFVSFRVLLSFFHNCTLPTGKTPLPQSFPPGRWWRDSCVERCLTDVCRWSPGKLSVRHLCVLGNTKRNPCMVTWLSSGYQHVLRCHALLSILLTRRCCGLSKHACCTRRFHAAPFSHVKLVFISQPRKRELNVLSRLAELGLSFFSIQRSKKDSDKI